MMQSARQSQNKWQLFRIKQEIINRIQAERKNVKWRAVQWLVTIKVINNIKQIP